MSDNTPSHDPAQVYDRLADLGVELDGKTGVASGQIPSEFNIHAAAVGLGIPNIEYEPETFPGLLYQPARETFEAVVVLFPCGDVVAIDAPSGVAAADALRQTLERLHDLELIDQATLEAIDVTGLNN